MIERVERKPQRVARAKWKPPPRLVPRKSRHRVPRLRLPDAKETGDPVKGYRGCQLFKGTHVCRIGEDRPGTIVGIGAQQCEVKWRDGATQSEITVYLDRYQ
jgi:hypothetical protein